MFYNKYLIINIINGNSKGKIFGIATQHRGAVVSLKSIAMMFTPYIFIPHFYTWSLLGLALILLLKWEITFKQHPERFATNTNEYIVCKNCTEKLCCHKKQLQGFIKKHKDKWINK